jgi:hypothetical protein
VSFLQWEFVRLILPRKPPPKRHFLLLALKKQTAPQGSLFNEPLSAPYGL